MCWWRFDGKKPSREKNNFCGKLVSLDYRPLHSVTLINLAEILCTFKVSVRELLKVFREKSVSKKIVLKSIRLDHLRASTCPLRPWDQVEIKAKEAIS